jgi:membrane protein DedA with SNARE-associated domain
VAAVKPLLHLLAGHAYLALFLAGLLERFGIPLLLSPFLVAAGALAASGDVRFDIAMWATLMACVIGDALWYEVGRKKGDSVLSFLCRISLERDSCVRHSKGLFEKGIARTLLLSKWLPGVSHIVPAVAGLVQIDRKRFLAINTLGSFLWIVAFLALGYLPVKQTHAADLVPAIAPAAIEVLLIFAVGNVVFKYTARRRFMQELYKARISPEELRHMIDEGRKVTIIDLRHALDSISDPRLIPGAIRMLPDDITSQAATLPRDQEIILYCT